MPRAACRNLFAFSDLIVNGDSDISESGAAAHHKLLDGLPIDSLSIEDHGRGEDVIDDLQALLVPYLFEEPARDNLARSIVPEESQHKRTAGATA